MLPVNEVILTAVFFALSRFSSGVADTEFKDFRELLDESRNESALYEKINTFPTPEHPLTTRGFCLGIWLFLIMD